MAILGNSLFSIIPGSNNGGNHVLNHSLATIMNGFRTVRPVVVEKFSFYPIQQRVASTMLEMLEFYAVLGAKKSKDLSYGRSHLRFQLMLGEIFPRNGFCHLWALIVFEICSGEVITRNLRILNGCRFAAKYFDLYTMKILRPSEPFSDSSSLSSTCMPTWGLKRYFRFCPGSISIHVPQFKEYSRRRTFSYKVTNTSR